MHVLTVEHIIFISPFLLIVIQVIDADRLTRLPAPVDEFLQNDGVALLDVHTPLVKPTCSIGSAGD